MGLGTDGLPPFKDFIQLLQLTTVASRRSQEFILRATPHAFPLANPRHTFLSSTLILPCRTSKPLFFKESFTVSIYLYHGLQSISTMAYLLSDYQHTSLHRHLVILSFPILSTWSNHRRTISSIFSSTPLFTPHNCVICAFGILSILLIPRKPKAVHLYSQTSRPLVLPLYHCLTAIRKNRH